MPAPKPPDPNNPADLLSHHLLRFAGQATLDPALPEPARMAACNDIVETLLAVGNREPIAAIVAARFTAAHLMTLECLRRSMRDGPGRDNQGEDSRIALRARAALLPQAADRFLLVLEQPRGPMPDARRLLTLPPDFSGVCDPMSGEEPDQETLPTPEAQPGPLRNGNPRRDLATLPCCGARTRAALQCRQPAMRNGRCRFHGGKSTGATTETGRAALSAKATRHGFHTAEGRRFLALGRRLLLTARLLAAAMRQAGIGLEAMEQAMADGTMPPMPTPPPKRPPQIIRLGLGARRPIWRPDHRPTRTVPRYQPVTRRGRNRGTTTGTQVAGSPNAGGQTGDGNNRACANQAGRRRALT